MILTTNEKTPELALAGIDDFFSSLAQNAPLITGVTGVVGGFSNLFTSKDATAETSSVAKNITEVKAEEAAKGFDWSSFLGVIDKAVDIGTGVWGGAPTSSIQVAQLELAKANAQTEAERAKAAQLIAATEQARLSQASPSQAVMNKTTMGISGGLLLAVAGAGALFFLSRKRGRR